MADVVSLYTEEVAVLVGGILADLDLLLEATCKQPIGGISRHQIQSSKEGAADAAWGGNLLRKEPLVQNTGTATLSCRRSGPLSPWLPRCCLSTEGRAEHQPPREGGAVSGARL